MSAVINRAKQRYIKAIKWEMAIIFLSFPAVIAVQSELNFSFLAGAISSFLPHCVFVYWIFFKSAKFQQKMTAFYWGEGMKWLMTMVLIILSVILLPALKVLFFFAGYFVALLLNIVLPVMLERHTT